MDDRVAHVDARGSLQLIQVTEGGRNFPLLGPAAPYLPGLLFRRGIMADVGRMLSWASGRDAWVTYCQ